LAHRPIERPFRLLREREREKEKEREKEREREREREMIATDLHAVVASLPAGRFVMGF
jgi:hypothetical protein